MVDVPVNKDVLVWARKTRGLSTQQAADRLKLSEEELAALEQGSRLPSVTLLDRIAKKYRIPFASLLMPEPLPDVARPVDFRTVQGREPVWDQQLLVGLESINSKVELLVELREHDPHLFGTAVIRNYRDDAPASAAATRERDQIGISLDTQLSWPTAAEAFRYWRHGIERAGVFVQIIDLGPENLCRGFSVFDERGIAVAVINGDETEGSARTFTLLHEYAHILIRKPGVSDQNRRNTTERWCNQFAAHFLMPAGAFRSDALNVDPNRGWSDTSLRKLADRYKVSMSAVALHLEELGLANPGLYDRKLEEWRMRKKRKGGGLFMPYAERQVHRLGARHVGVVLDAVDRREISPIDAFEMTDVDPKHFDDLKKELSERQRVYGGVR